MSSVHSCAWRHTGFAMLAAIFGVASRSLAAPPPAPVVQYGSDVKQVIFDWNIAPHSNYYELWFKANDGAAPVKFGERKPWEPHWTNNISAHLIHWSQARWEIRACNPSGCSTSGLINIGSTIVTTVGFFKTPAPQTLGRFGEVVAISEDSQTFVANEGHRLFVFHKVNGDWLPEANFEPSQVGPKEWMSASLSANGNVLAVGVPGETRGDEGENDQRGGAVYIFERTDTQWREVFHKKIPTSIELGRYVRVTESGDGVGAPYAWRSGTSSGSAIDIYRRTATGWEDGPSLFDPGNASGCSGHALSRDGNVVARRCTYGGVPRIEVLAASGWTLRYTVPLDPEDPLYMPDRLALDCTGNTIAYASHPLQPPTGYDSASWKPHVDVFHRVGTVYSKVAVLAPSPWQPTSSAKRSFFGTSVELSRDGGYIAVTDPRDAIGGLVEPPPTHGSNIPPRGAVYLFERRGTSYALRRHIGVTTKSTSIMGQDDVIGNVAMADNGKTLIVGEPANASRGSRSDDSLPDAGAVWLY